MTDFFNLILEPLQEVFLMIKTFLPNLLAMLVILLVGILAGPGRQGRLCKVPGSDQVRQLVATEWA